MYICVRVRCIIPPHVDVLMQLRVHVLTYYPMYVIIYHVYSMISCLLYYTHPRVLRKGIYRSPIIHLCFFYIHITYIARYSLKTGMLQTYGCTDSHRNLTGLCTSITPIQRTTYNRTVWFNIHIVWLCILLTILDSVSGGKVQIYVS